MDKISVKNIVEFRKKSEKGQKTFLTNLNKPKESNPDDKGGNYWVRSLSALSNAFKYSDNQIIKNKIEDISADYQKTSIKKTQKMYQRNLDILYNYEDFDFSEWKSGLDFEIYNKKSKKSILMINNIPVQITPHQIFTFNENELPSIGGIWFIAKLDSFKKEELGVFAEALYRFLNANFSKDYIVSSKYCLIVDVLNLKEINYKMILDEEIPSLLDSTLDSIKKLL